MTVNPNFRTEDPSLSQYPSPFNIPPASSTTTSIMSQDNVALIPVHQEDFKKLNEFAEAAWICRDLKNADKIKEMRKTLLKEVLIYYQISKL